MRIAIDAMGGDHAPQEIVAGAVLSLESISEDDSIVLVGRKEEIERVLANLPEWKDDARIEIAHASEVIEMGDNPVEALKQKKDSSIARMVELSADGKVDAAVSAGNTGACVAACQMKLGRLKGVIRPGIAVIIPSFAGSMVLCDVGANPAPKPHHIHQYALMASIYAENVFNLNRPARVALLNIGEEDAKGNPLVKQARDLIKADPRINFAGYVEGRTIFSGLADVVVCDGFVGNVVLKLIEGLVTGLVQMLTDEVKKSNRMLIKLFSPFLNRLLQKHDYSEHGGAPLLGVNGVFIICHGSSDRRAIKNAISVAYNFARSNINQLIVERIATTPEVARPTEIS